MTHASFIPPVTVRNTADMVALASHEGKIYVLLILRAKEPFKGRWALPGGHVDEGEDLLTAAKRELKEETKLDAQYRLAAQVGTFGSPTRDPRGHYISTAYVVIFDGLQEVEGADDAKEARWFDVSELSEDQLAFDHALILKLAMTKVHLTYCPMRGHPSLHLLMRPEVECAARILGNA